MTLFCKGGTVFAVLLLLGFIGCVWINGFLDLTWSMLSFGPEGMGSMLFNTLYIVILALIFSLITGLPAGVYLAEYAEQGKVTRWVRMAIETLASLPSIVVGLFGYLAFIVMTHSQWNLLAGSLAVTVITLPFVTSVTEDAIRNLPPGYRQGSLGLGASHWQTIWRVLVPACLPRIMTGMVMAAGRGFGEAAALMFTAGMSTDIDWNDWNVLSPACALNPFRPGETLALHIWALRTEALQADAAEQAGAASAVLVLLVVVFSLLARYLSWRLDQKMGGSKT